MLNRLFGNKSKPVPIPAATAANRRQPLNQVDLAFVVDTTSSMGPFINAARQQMIDMLQAISRQTATTLEQTIDLAVGLVEYRDHPPEEPSFVTRPYPFTANLGEVRRVIKQLQPSGGGDGPEAVFDGLQAACQQLKWRDHAQRMMLLVGDAPPHGVGAHGDNFRDGCPCGLTLPAASCLVEAQGVLLYTLGMTRAVEPSFGELARLTGGVYFAAANGAQAIAAIQQILTAEFADLAFDQQVLSACQGEWTIDQVCTALNQTRGRVSASISRLGRRKLL